MTDKLTSLQRHNCMSSIHGKNTKPEILVRKGLHARGFRFRLHNKKLPGCPDIVLPKYDVAIMVNGCFWHGHEGCKYFVWPKNNSDFWHKKISDNILRDQRKIQALDLQGWKVIVVWECKIKSDKENTLKNLIKEIKVDEN